MIRKNTLVELASKDLTSSSGIVMCDPYMTIITFQNELTSKTIESSEVLVVDVLIDGEVYKKIPIINLRKVR